MLDRSPLISAANTGTPVRAKPSAITCSDTVLPVPVAPVTRPWRLASPSVNQAGCSPLPIKILSSVSPLTMPVAAIWSFPPLQNTLTGDRSPGASRILPITMEPFNDDRGETLSQYSSYRGQQPRMRGLPPVRKRISRPHFCNVATLAGRIIRNDCHQHGGRLCFVAERIRMI